MKQSLSDALYEAAKVDPIASLILEALHAQDARTYHGESGDIGGLALNTAALIRMRLAAEGGESA